MYAGVGSNVCVTNVGHSMLARVGDVYCVAHVEAQGQLRPTAHQNKGSYDVTRTKHGVITGIITSMVGSNYYERSL